MVQSVVQAMPIVFDSPERTRTMSTPAPKPVKPVDPNSEAALPRPITHHKVEGDNSNKVDVHALDGAGPGNASHEYMVRLNGGPLTLISFQNGPVKEAGYNGGTVEALIAVAMDRMHGFQTGPFAGDDNQEALEHLAAAMECLHRRTVDRVKRGVEGESKK